MRFHWMAMLGMAMLATVALGACSLWSSSRNFSVFFPAYSADLDDQADQTIRTAATFANAKPALPVEIAGFSAPPDPQRDVEGLSANRAAVVKKMLIGNGVRADRITTVANGITDPKTLPTVAVRRVDINVGR